MVMTVTYVNAFIKHIFLNCLIALDEIGNV